MPTEWSGRATDYPRDSSIAALFEAEAAAHPETVAVESGPARLTYGALDHRANRLAHALRARAVTEGSRVGVCLERSADFVAAVLAILKAGGAYVPLDRSYPAARLAFMVREAGIGLIIGDGWPGTPSAGTNLTLAELETAGRELPDSPPAAGPTALSMAYVMFTSGSTGQPKAVAVPHRAVVRLVRGTDYLQMDSTHRVLGFAPLAFDASTLELWGPLLNGGVSVLFEGELSSLADLGRFIEERRITTAWLTAGLFRQMVDAELPRLSGLRYLLAGGEVVSPAHARAMLDAFPYLTLINGYGPTENTTFTTCHRIMLADVRDLAPIPIGRPIANTTVHVLDTNGAEQPVGVAGELYTGGDGLALGYLNQPELTAERFVPDPFGKPGERLYRTGDLVRRRSDGVLEFLGRVDHQVKLRGYRIELGEIEAALSTHPAVREAAVLLREDEPGQPRLAGYLVTRDPGLDAGAIRDFLSGLLPDFMIPSSWVTLPSFPLTPSGKIDRANLPSPGPGDRSRSGFEAPSTEPERRIAMLFEDVLRCGPVGRGEDFFSLGGDSLSAMRIGVRLHEDFGVEVPFSTILQHRTPASLADAVEQRKRQASPGGMSGPIRPRPRGGSPAPQ